MRSPRSLRARSGFSLIELLVATSLLVIGMTGILALFTTALRLENEAEERTDVSLALPEAVREIQRTVGVAFYGAAAGPTAGTKGRKNSGLGGEFELTAAGGAYKCRWSTDAAPDAGDARALFAKVEIVVGAGTTDEKVYDFGRLPVVPEPPVPGTSK